jgi:hypothetical protein
MPSSIIHYPANSLLGWDPVKILLDLLGNMGQDFQHELAVAVHLSFDDGSLGIIAGQVHILDGKTIFPSNVSFSNDLMDLYCSPTLVRLLLLIVRLGWQVLDCLLPLFFHLCSSKTISSISIGSLSSSSSEYTPSCTITTALS